MSQKNSFTSLLEQISVLNKNSVEIITKLNDVVGSENSEITFNYLDSDETISTFSLPSVGFLKSEIDLANNNIKKLSNLKDNESVIITDDNSSKKIKSIDLNREPKQIANVDLISTFNQNNNWFFESLMNPLLSVEVNLSDKIEETTNKVLSRRYIVQFEKDSDGEYTTAGLSSLRSFEDTFLYKNNSTISDFQNWVNETTNTGVINKDEEHLYTDDQIFDVNYKEIDYKGYFSVLKYEKDEINNKLWYQVNTLTYFNRNGDTQKLAVGDTLATTRVGSYTKWKILEVNTSSSLFRLNLERIEGYDPVAIGTNVIEYYSPLTSDNTINVSIGFDEYNIIFLKPINTDNSIIGSTWSKGVAFYTNDLTLSTDSNVNMSDFYVSTVHDYGSILKDMVVKNIPSALGITPLVPEIISDNFKVVQINKHLTDTVDQKSLKKLHGQKNSIKGRISQVNDSIIEKNKQLNTKIFKSVAERSSSQNELTELIVKQESETKLYNSYVSQITNSSVESTATPKFRIRGFWDIPSAIIKSGSKSQEVIGFIMQWRYGSKYGTENTTEGFEMKTKNTSSSTTDPDYLKSTGYFSEWNTQKTDIRTRTYDETDDEWYWEIEDISDADTPNINQLDIAISKNEKVEIRIKSISEVGYPDSPLTSDWSTPISVEFPDSLNDVLGDSEFILKEASKEEVKVQFENELASKGINKHVQESYFVNDNFVAHKDSAIITTFKDTYGNSINLHEYLVLMSDRLNVLEEAITRAKGELKVTLYNGTNETEINNGANIEMVVECEDYCSASSGTTTATSLLTKRIDNYTYLISDYYLKFENIAAANPLALLTNKDLTSNNANGTNINSDGNLIKQKPYQYLWLLDTATVDTSTGLDTIDLYSHNYALDSLSSGTVVTDHENLKLLDNDVEDILSSFFWQSELGNVPSGDSISGPSNQYFGATLHPLVQNDTTLVDNNNDQLHIVEAQDDFTLPLNLYFRPDIHQADGVVLNITQDKQPMERLKTIKFSTQPENLSRTFEFTITFKLKRHRKTSLRFSDSQSIVDDIRDFG